jgi:hypothetical protein
VLKDRLRLLGPDHPHTLMTRKSLASLSGEVGRMDQLLRSSGRCSRTTSECSAPTTQRP